MLNRHHLQLLCNQLLQIQRRPTFEQVWPWVGVSLAFLLPLTSAEFRDFLGLKAATWEGFALFGFVASIGVLIWRIILALRYVKSGSPSAEKIVTDLLGMLKLDQRERLHDPKDPGREEQLTREEQERQ